MHPTSEPAHESSSQTSPGAAKRTYDERAAFEEVKRNLGIVGDKEQEYNRGLELLSKAYSIGMTLILVYFLLDAYQILVTAGRSVNIGSFLSYALPKVLPDALLVVPFLWFVLDWVKDGYINPRRLTMLYLLLCFVSGVLSFAGVFGMAQVLFPAFTALDSASHPVAASSIVTQVLVAVITAGSAVLMFLLTRPAVGAVPSRAVIRKQMWDIEKNTSGAEDEELTREDVLRQLEKEEGPVKDSTEQLLRELSADYALSNDPVEKNRLLDEIQQVQRAQKAGVKPNLGGASAGGADNPQAHEDMKATAPAAPAAPQVVLPPRPKALRGVMWCFIALMVVEASHGVFRSMIYERSLDDVGLWAGYILSETLFILVVHAIPTFILWRLWRGRTWAYVVIFISFAYIAIKGLIDFVNTFLTTGYLSRLLDGTQTWGSPQYATYVLSRNVADTLITLLSILIVVLLLSRSTRSYVATARFERLKAREQINAGDGWVVLHQDAEMGARLDEEQTRREEKEANRRAEEAVAQQYKTTRRTDARKNSRNEQRGYKDTSVYTEEGYRLN